MSSATASPPVAETAECLHCSQPFRPVGRRRAFCCAGCEFVHGLLRQNGLEKFYELRGTEGQPVKPHVFELRDFEWLREMVSGTEAKSLTPVLVLDLQGISCMGCVWLIERVFQRMPGGLSIEVNSVLGQVRIQWVAGEFDPAAFARELQSFGYLLAPPGKGEARESRALVRRTGVCAALAMNCMLFTVPVYLGMDDTFEYAGLFGFLAMVFATAAFMAGGSYFIHRSWNSLSQGVVHIDLPIALGIVFAYSGSLYSWARADHSFVYFDFVAIFIFLMLVGRWTQQLAVEKNRNYLLGLQSRGRSVMRSAKTPEAAEARVPIAELARDDRFRMPPGQFLPVRSLLLSGDATFGMEWINGESEARIFRQGQAVPAGAIPLGSADAEFRAEEDWKDSFLERLTSTPVRGPDRNPLIERVITIYIACVLAVGAIGFGAWYLAAGEAFTALQVLISVLVVSCPCAIGVAWPLTDELAAAFLRKHGVFIRESGLWHRLARVRKILFDKTGTLTLEHLVLVNPEALDALSVRALAVLRRMVEGNLHPASRCLRQELLVRGECESREDGASVAIEEVVGAGLQAAAPDGVWRLGRPDWACVDAASFERERGTVCAFTLEGEVLAAFRMEEEIRPDACREVFRMRERGLEVYVLSGDRREKVRAMTRELGLPPENGLAEMSPTAKAEWVVRNDERDTLMVGDGANDSLAFDATWCRGTPAVDRGLLENKADFYFLGKGIDGIRILFETSEKRSRTLRRVFAFTIGYNVMTLTLCLAGKMNPLVAAIVMPLSALISLASVWIQRPGPTAPVRKTAESRSRKKRHGMKEQSHA